MDLYFSAAEGLGNQATANSLSLTKGNTDTLAALLSLLRALV